MSTKVILLERIGKLGIMGDVVSVRPGYARNYLLPQKKALRASAANLTYFEAQKKHLQAENDKTRKDAEKIAAKIEGVKIALIRQASEGGQLFGSVSARDIAEEAANTTGQTITRAMVRLNGNFKLLGLFPVEVALHPEVIAHITINIARSDEEAAMQAKTGKALISSLQDDERSAPKDLAPDDAALESALDDDALSARRQKEAEEAAEEETDA
ncbi:MAG: 50S ribosomal protein L9 [Alphaproteobacteria bacterium]|nr:50S ribosomal protein L9 [Alphaproteobacteria bacterium]